MKDGTSRQTVNEYLPRSSSGQEPGLSIQVMGFDSPTGRLCGRDSSGKRAGCDPAKAGSIPVRPTEGGAIPKGMVLPPMR